MLPAARRLRRPEDFTGAVRHGVRAGRPTLVVHLAADGTDPAIAGLIIAKSVGGSVVRHRVARRIRHQIAEMMDEMPPGTRLVVRALPAAAQADSAQLGSDLRSAVRQARARQSRTGPAAMTPEISG